MKYCIFVIMLLFPIWGKLNKEFLIYLELSREVSEVAGRLSVMSGPLVSLAPLESRTGLPYEVPLPRIVGDRSNTREVNLVIACDRNAKSYTSSFFSQKTSKASFTTDPTPTHYPIPLHRTATIQSQPCQQQTPSLSSRC
jgi:hypothetical protein